MDSSAEPRAPDAERRFVPFVDVVSDVSGGNGKVRVSEYAVSGTLPVIDQGQSVISGYTDDLDKAFRKADLPVVLFGDHSKAVKYADYSFAMGADGVKVLKPSKECDAKYLYHFLRQVRLPHVGYSRHFKFLKRLSIPLPPLPQQRRIAAILDKAEALRQKRHEAIAKLDQLLQSVFLEMFPGIGHFPISIGKPPRGEVDKFVPLTDVATLATGHTPDRSRPDYWDGDIPWVSLTDIRRVDGCVAAHTAQSITQAGIDNSSAVRLPADTVCFSRTASVGFATILGTEMATSQDFVNWICGPRLVPLYLMWAFIQSRRYMLSQSTGSTHKTIYFPTAKRFHIYLPPIEQQYKFADIARKIADHEQRIQQQEPVLNKLFGCFQQRAFAGQL